MSFNKSRKVHESQAQLSLNTDGFNFGRFADPDVFASFRFFSSWRIFCFGFCLPFCLCCRSDSTVVLNLSLFSHYIAILSICSRCYQYAIFIIIWEEFCIFNTRYTSIKAQTRFRKTYLVIN